MQPCRQKHETQPKNPISPPKQKDNLDTLWPMLCVQKGYTDIKNGTVHIVSLHFC